MLFSPPILQARPQANFGLPHQLDRVAGLAMLVLASTVFAYYTIWTLLMVRNILDDDNVPYPKVLTSSL